MAKFKFPKLSKFQTTKVIVFTILIVWVICTFGLLGVLIFKKELFDTRVVELMSIYNYVTDAMKIGVLGYLAKSVYENQNKYGKTPYGTSTTDGEKP